MANLCRLCGKQKFFIDMVIEIHDEFMETKLSCKDIIQKYCHVELDSNKLLALSVCDEYKGTIQHFVSFCNVVEQVQLKMKKNYESKLLYEIKECCVQLQNINNAIKTSDLMLNSSPNNNFFEMVQYELDSDFDEQLEDANTEAEHLTKLKVSSNRRKDVLVCVQFQSFN